MCAMPERMKWWFRGGSEQQEGPLSGGLSGAGARFVRPSKPSLQPLAPEDAHRQSRGLEQFLTCIREVPPSSILDMGGANQANITFLANLGHRISAENLLYSLDTVWNQSDLTEARKIEEFLDQTLNYQAASFGGALLWDSLEYLPEPLLEAVLARIYQLLNTGAPILAFFHADDRTQAVSTFTYRIVDAKTLMLGPQGARQRMQFLNNRAIERLFASYKSVKFFLTRDHLREVLIRR